MKIGAAMKDGPTLALWLALACLLPACTSKPPDNPESLCAILKQYPSWHSPLKQAERRWEVHPAIIMAFIYQESSFIPHARPPEERARSRHDADGAWGYGQAIRSTWQEYQRDTGNSAANREKFADVVDFIGWYNAKTHTELGILLRVKKADRLYLAFHEGRGGYERRSYEEPDKKWLRQVAKRVAKRASNYSREYKFCTVSSERQRRVRPLH